MISPRLQLGIGIGKSNWTFGGCPPVPVHHRIIAVVPGGESRPWGFGFGYSTMPFSVLTYYWYCIMIIMMVITANIQLTKTFYGLLFYFKHPPTRISFKPEDFIFGIDTWYYVPTACYGAVRQAACPLFFLY
jgi:hypothetical protein